jgi:predicted AlkP superfamily pyrophosphatase or phosphodiesterase
MKPRCICSIVLAMFAFLIAANCPAQDATQRRAILIGVDGLSVDGVRQTKGKTFPRLLREGASTLHARGVMPTSSSPNWASMIMGAGPEQHGITSNDWEPDKHTITPSAKGPGGLFPSIFSILRQQRPSTYAAVVHEWKGFGRLVEPKSADVVDHARDADETVKRAIKILREKKPTFLMIHLDMVDHAGHDKGWGSPEYTQAVEKADALIGEVLAALKEAGLAESTLVIVSSDHGGLGTKHGGESMIELEIPWIAVGPGVQAGHEIKGPVNTFDTAATLAWWLGLKPPAAWIGKPVAEAFKAEPAGAANAE